MRITHNEQTLVIGWSYRDSQHHLATTDTICKISEVQPDGSLKELTRGTASCSVTDTFKKEPGRKLSLQRAVLTKVPNDPNDLKGTWSYMFPEEVRVKIYQEYFTSRKRELPKELVR